MNIEIPEHIKRLRFDIGLSYCAPNSAVWLRKKSSDLYVIGIEPNAFCVENIKNNGIYCQQYNINPFKTENFHLINCALDDVESPKIKTFYNMEGDPGTSSLLKPTYTLGYSIKNTSQILTVSFKSILEKLPWDRFEYIELVKIDTQGKDLDIIKSAGSYLEKIVFLNCEVNTFDHYEKNPKPEEYEEYLSRAGFIKISEGSKVNNQVVDATYINQRYNHLISVIDCFVL